MAPKIPIEHRHLAEVCQRHHIRSLALFGSVLRDDFGPASDVDVLVEFEPDHVPGLDFFLIEEELSRLFGQRVDLNTHGFLGPELLDRVLAEAEVQFVHTSFDQAVHARLLPPVPEVEGDRQQALLGSVEILGDILEPVLPAEDWEVLGIRGEE